MSISRTTLDRAPTFQSWSDGIDKIFDTISTPVMSTVSAVSLDHVRGVVFFLGQQTAKKLSCG